MAFYGLLVAGQYATPHTSGAIAHSGRGHATARLGRVMRNSVAKLISPYGRFPDAADSRRDSKGRPVRANARQRFLRSASKFETTVKAGAIIPQ